LAEEYYSTKDASIFSIPTLAPFDRVLVHLLQIGCGGGKTSNEQPQIQQEHLIFIQCRIRIMILAKSEQCSKIFDSKLPIEFTNDVCGEGKRSAHDCCHDENLFGEEAEKLNKLAGGSALR